MEEEASWNDYLFVAFLIVGAISVIVYVFMLGQDSIKLDGDYEIICKGVCSENNMTFLSNSYDDCNCRPVGDYYNVDEIISFKLAPI